MLQEIEQFAALLMKRNSQDLRTGDLIKIWEQRYQATQVHALFIHRWMCSLYMPFSPSLPLLSSPFLPFPPSFSPSLPPPISSPSSFFSINITIFQYIFCLIPQASYRTREQILSLRRVLLDLLPRYVF